MKKKFLAILLTLIMVLQIAAPALTVADTTVIATVDGTDITSLADLWTATVDASSIVLKDNVNMTDSGYGSEQMRIQSAGDVTLDLGGKTFTGMIQSGNYISNSTGTNLTISNGTVISDYRNQSGAMLAPHAVWALQHKVTILNGRFESNNAVLVSQLQTSQNDQVGINVKNGTFVNKAFGGVVVSDVIGNVVIDGGSFTSTADACSMFVIEEGDDDIINAITINGGSFTNAYTMFDFMTSYESYIYVKGGTFEGKGFTYNEQEITPDLICHNHKDETKHHLIITGGTFKGFEKTAIENYVPEGYVVTDNGDDTYTVSQPAPTPVAQNFYPDAQDANLYHIANLEGLKEFRDSVNGGTDYLGKTIRVDQNLEFDLAGSDWVPIGGKTDGNAGNSGADRSTPFRGTFDGNGLTVKNLTITDSTMDYAGLFGFMTNATLKNINIVNVNISACNAIGAIVGGTQASTAIDNCTVTGTIRLSGNHYVGGISGWSYAKTTNCTVNGGSADSSLIHAADMTANAGDGDDVGGILGFAGEANVEISGCAVSNVTIEGFRQVGGIAGIARVGRSVQNNTISNVTIRCIADAYTATNKAAKMAFGGIVGVLDGGNVTVKDNTVTNVSLQSTDTGKAVARMGFVTGGLYASSKFEIPAETTYSGSNNVVTNCTRVAGTLAPVTDHILIDGPALTYVAEIGSAKYETLADAIAVVKNNETIVLLPGIENETGWASINNGKTFTIDLNGQTLKRGLVLYSSFVTLKDSAETKGEITASVYVYTTADSTVASGAYNTLTLDSSATINAHYGIVLYPVNGKTGYGSKVTVNGTIHGNLFVSGNIEAGNSVVDVHGTIDATNQSDVGIALNGYATVNIYNGAVVTSQNNGKGTGIEVRAGNLNVTGGTITGHGAPASASANGSGTTSIGAGICVSTYEISNINVSISGGTISGYSPLYLTNTKGTTNKALTLSVSGGTFICTEGGAVAVAKNEAKPENRAVGFIIGGTFSSEPAADYIALGYEAKENAGKWTVVQKENVTVTVEETSGDDTTATVAIGGQSVATVEVKIAPAATVAAVEKATAATVKTVEEAVNVSKVVEKAMDNGTIVAQQNTIELLVKADDTPVAVPNVTVEQGAAVFKVDPYAIVNGDTENPIKLTNDDLATNSTGFTFTLSLGTSFAGQPVMLKHYSDAGKLQKTWAATADASGNVEVTLTSFSYIVGEAASVSAECAGYLAYTDADIRASLLWNVFFYINTDLIANPQNAKIVVSSAYDEELDGTEYSLTAAANGRYKITVPIRHRLINQDVGFTLVYNNTAYNMKLGASGQEYLSVPYSFNAYLSGALQDHPEYASVIEAVRAYADALLAKWPVDNN